MYVHNVLLEVVSVELTFKGWLTPMSDQDGISTFGIDGISRRPVTRIKQKYQLGDYYLIWYQILPTDIIRIVWETVRRITYEILRVKGLK